MHPKLEALNLAITADYIKSLQLPSGAILWNRNDKLDPWDHVEAAMGLSVAGFIAEAAAAYQWLADNQLPDGSWRASYFTETANSGKETNFIGYVATGIWHHYLVTGDEAFLNRMFPMVARALDFVLLFQSPHGEISWAVNEANQPAPDALLTACASLTRSLECGIKAAEVLGIYKPHWPSAWQTLAQAVKSKPERFDRTWESKARFAMDWYYPVLAGLYWVEEGQARLAKRWNEFVEAGLGCRCVSDEPWVTMAETAELVIALLAADEPTKAHDLFATLAQWQQSDGGFVTGFVFRDNTIWPEDKTSWTAGAVLLAADALFDLTPASTLFTTTSPTLTCS
ncbi:MAG: prenyltransferase [Marinagarivorans sp.]|nr:prenyltransferase [Marinagarivorans sp.]